MRVETVLPQKGEHANEIVWLVENGGGSAKVLSFSVQLSNALER